MWSLIHNNTIFSYESLVRAVAGGCGSAVAMTTFFPLDTVRTRLQLDDSKKSKGTYSVLKEIYELEGLAGLYRGLLPVVESLYCSNFVYFYTFHGLKRLQRADQSAVKDLLFAMVAGSINVLSTNPLWVVNSRLKMQGAKGGSYEAIDRPEKKYRGLVDGMCRMIRDEGFVSLWAGTLSSLILVINPAIQFMTYEAVKRQLQKMYGPGDLNSSTVFLVGALAKAVATVITYPIQLVQAKQRHGHTYKDLPQNAGVLMLLTYIIRKYGLKGLYRGMEAKILQTVLAAALMFVCYERIASFVLLVMMGQRKHARVSS